MSVGEPPLKGALRFIVISERLFTHLTSLQCGGEGQGGIHHQQQLKDK